MHLLVPEGLQPVMDAPIYGRIVTMELFRPPVSQRVSLSASPLQAWGGGFQWRVCAVAATCEAGEAGGV